ncbi:MAG TPA: ABC transporter permease [Galbitalea sp.]|nr:ABC transporter permease [Galbitalea sp.]
MTTSTSPTPHTPWIRSTALGVILAAVVTVIVLAFLWPSVTATPKGIPVVLAGPSSQSAPVEAALMKASPGTFAFTVVADRARAVRLIKENKDYGAIVLGNSPEVLTASAANLTIAQQLDALAPKLQVQRVAAATAQHIPPSAIGTIKTVDVVPLLSTDPRGSTIGASSIPMVIGGIIGGALISLLVVGVWRRLVALGVYCVVGSAAITGVLQGWFGGLGNSYFANAGAIALVLLGIGGVILGCVALLGAKGIAVGPVLFLLGATPISAAAVPIEFLAKPWGAVGQWFPPGAGATLLRQLSYFPNANTTFPWLVLAGWALLGLVLSTLGHFRNNGAVTAGAEARAEEATA